MTASFADPAHARLARDFLLNAGFPAESISLNEGAASVAVTVATVFEQRDAIEVLQGAGPVLVQSVDH